ncbi:MAG: hypothetical protein AAGC91_14095 [Pseudomonadota bacterium]
MATSSDAGQDATIAAETSDTAAETADTEDTIDTIDASTAEQNLPLDATGVPMNMIMDSESGDAARRELMKDVFAYETRISEIERTEGAFGAGLAEQLLGMGLAQQRNGDHFAAIQTFKRGVHLARINEGLYSERQMALLQGEIASHIAMGDFTAADERQRYLFRVQAETLSDVSRGQALMQHAVWQRQAYEQGLGEQPFSRLLRMSSLYRLALSEIASSEGDTSPSLLPPLYGMLRSQYLVSGFVGETSTGRFRTRGMVQEEESQQTAYRSQSFKRGSSVIRAIYDIEMAQPDATWEVAARASLMLADWQLWHGKRNDAFETYAGLFGELEVTDAAKVWRNQAFAEPRPLPDIDGVRGLPERAEGEAGNLLVEFGVTERGRVVDLKRLDTYASNDEKADDIIRRIKQSLFRPRFSDGMPVRTAGLRWAYDIRQW